MGFDILGFLAQANPVQGIQNISKVVLGRDVVTDVFQALGDRDLRGLTTLKQIAGAQSLLIAGVGGAALAAPLIGSASIPALAPRLLDFASNHVSDISSMLLQDGGAIPDMGQDAITATDDDLSGDF